MKLTAKQHHATRQIFVLMKSNRRKQQLRSAPLKVVSSIADLRNSLAHATNNSLWISYERTLTEALLKHVSWPTGSLGDAVLIHSMTPQTLATLANCFKRFAFSTNEGFLPFDELTDALKAANNFDLFVGGTVDSSSKTITLWRGSLESLTVPFAAFQKSGDGTTPDFARFSITDCGQTIHLGDYEASADAILYEFDSEYRRRISKQRRETEQSFGASLRRLRKQRGLRREDFGPELAAKTIARIEQGQVSRIQKKTLRFLADKLQVRPDEIATY